MISDLFQIDTETITHFYLFVKDIVHDIVDEMIDSLVIEDLSGSIDTSLMNIENKLKVIILKSKFPCQICGFSTDYSFGIETHLLTTKRLRNTRPI